MPCLILKSLKSNEAAKNTTYVESHKLPRHLTISCINLMTEKNQIFGFLTLKWPLYWEILVDYESTRRDAYFGAKNFL